VGKQIVEINGVKLEVDLRDARTIDTYKVGDNVKVLIPKYADTFESRCGVIIGFDDFQKQPTIVVAYLDVTYSEAKIEMAYVHQGSKYEITHASDGDIPFSKKQILDLLDGQIAKQREALNQATWRKTQFETWFGKYCVQAEVPTAAQ